ncbi:MAG: pullulanase [Aestuariivita sp.]|nr:pullulanase [Aestuariivita sp.]
MTDISQMSLQKDPEMVPRAMVRAVCGLLLAVLVLVGYSSITDRPPVAVAPAGEIVLSKSIVIKAQDSGAIRIFEKDGVLIADLSAGQGGFISSIARTIKRQRILSNVSLDGPVILTSDTLGRLKITDPSSGWSADLMSFGADNSGAFAVLLAE